MAERQVPVDFDGETIRLLQSRSSSLSYGKKNQNLSSFELGEDTHLIGNSRDDLSEMLALRNRSERSGQGRRGFLGFSLNRHVSDWTFLGSFWGSPNEDEGEDDSPHVPRRKRLHGLFPPDYDFQTSLFLTICYLLVLIYSLLIHVGPLLLYFRAKRDWCLLEAGEGGRMLAKNSRDHAGGFADADNPYENPDYDIDPCRYIRLPELCFLTLEECDISRRLLMSVILGGAIGYERRIADRPAGIRTMGLVSLGACFFTVSSIMGFKTSTMGWDASRVTAALPSGVGFLGGALIWKGTVFVDDQEMHQVHGLTTAASLWLSAAIGVGVGGGLYLVTIYATILVIMVLRYGPKVYHSPDDDEDLGGDGNNEADMGDTAQQTREVSEPLASPTSQHSAQSLSGAYSRRSSRGEFIDRKAVPADNMHITRKRRSTRDLPTFHS